MKATTKQVLTGAAWLAVLLAMIGGVILWQHQVRKAKPVTAVTVTSTERIPMVLLLDSHLTHQQNQQLTANIQHNSASQTLVTAKASTNGTVVFKGQLLNSDNRPYIQVQLPTGISTTKKAQLLKRVLGLAQQHFKFRRFNLVSYGDGGLTATTYVEQTTIALTPQHLVLIATPFNGTGSQNRRRKTTPVAAKNQTAALKTLIAKRKTINPKLQVLIIAEKSAKSKQTLPLQSALAGQSIFKPTVKRYQQHVVRTWRTESGILNSRRIGNIIQPFIN
ncbi:alpha/beta hydrolase [Lactiplantibacillus pentosus]|uniref:alpha/beta hydrolase n=1 Tax=Lactiplantibacillus pentosus TaxID=1589 RepID=UPI000EA942CE|nr:alpha/beta hydrolase [Lactiplantibacillus pentosus]AYG38473.1 alpha/beta hydrolase [Lactiplantibacillus pentosus]AYG41133.1 alpha/beta hydrolase [Lactiplantibacillus pentosus]MCJ8180818.1 alpha/beta hydrolase [Lactiplantibacillus pentosus]